MNNQEFFDELFNAKRMSADIFEMITFLSMVDFDDREICKYTGSTMNCLYRLMDILDTKLTDLEESFRKEHKTLYPVEKMHMNP